MRKGYFPLLNLEIGQPESRLISSESLEWDVTSEL